MYPFGHRGWDTVCGVILTPAHSDFHHSWFVYQNLSQSFTTYSPEAAQLRDPVMAFESCGLCAHSSVLKFRWQCRTFRQRELPVSHLEVVEECDRAHRLPHAAFVASYSENSRHTLLLSYSATSGLIWNCPGLTSTVGDPTVPLLAAFAGACSFGSARFFR